MQGLQGHISRRGRPFTGQNGIGNATIPEYRPRPTHPFSYQSERSGKRSFPLPAFAGFQKVQEEEHLGVYTALA